MLFKWSEFTSAAGLRLNWKIECDALDEDDWECISQLALPMVGKFHLATGVPRGGLQLAERMMLHRDERAMQHLLVDDVWTTGLSMKRQAEKLGLVEGEWTGFVVFARGISLPPWVQCLCKINAV